MSTFAGSGRRPTTRSRRSSSTPSGEWAMSSKTAPDPRPWSLALRLTLWYAASSFALVLVATGYLYWALARELLREDDEWLAGKVAEVRTAAELQPTDGPDFRRVVEAGGGRPAERI